VTVADRALPDRTEISPKKSPTFRRRIRSCPPCVVSRTKRLDRARGDHEQAVAAVAFGEDDVARLEVSRRSPRMTATSSSREKR
jgi:hypothetical protein